MIGIGPISDCLTYNEAWLYCITLDYDGHKDWRMPTSIEYNDLPRKGWYVERIMTYQVSMGVIPIRDV